MKLLHKKTLATLGVRFVNCSVFITIMLACLFFSCQKEEFNRREDSLPKSSTEERSQLKSEFGQALALSVKESASLRLLLKEEALKMFDNDYDILYHMIKNKNLAEGLSVRQLIVKYMDSEERLAQVESLIPSLTIFVPELPENSFSAEIWNPENQIPIVGISLEGSNDVKMIDNEGKSYILKSHQIPSFPVVVIKESERIVVNDKQARKAAKGRSFRSSDNLEFSFLDDAFDGSIKQNLQTNGRTVCFMCISSGYLANAYTIYNKYYPGTGWQRDYVYYDIFPGREDGEFSYAHQENINMFKMVGDPIAAYNKISDQTGDPQAQAFTGNPNSGWTGGNYEFKVRVLLNGTNGVGQELITYFSAPPRYLFTLKYKYRFPLYEIETITTKEMGLSLPLFSWDLNSYSTSILIDIEEVDETVTTVITDSRQVKFATNFSIEGTIKKIGLKFGASLERTETQSIQRTYTEGNDQLGAVIVNFGDDVLLDKVPSPTGGENWIIREYSTGFYAFSIEPTLVQ